MGKCGVFIPSHSHQAIPIPIPIPMKLTYLAIPIPTGPMGPTGIPNIDSSLTTS